MRALSKGGEGVSQVTYSELSEAVRSAVEAAADDTLEETVERARETIVGQDAVSVMTLETDHADLGRVHWIVAHPGEADRTYMVVAIADRPAEGQPCSLFTAGSEDLSEAFRELFAACGTPELPEPARPAA